MAPSLQYQIDLQSQISITKIVNYFQMLITEYSIKRKLIRELEGLYNSIWKKKYF